jgi:hypothetical protein
MLASEALRVCLDLARVLDDLGAPYLVGGSLASSLYGVPRSTQDADLVADLREEHVVPFVAALEGRFYVDEERVRHAVRRRSSFNVLELATMFKVDIFLAGGGKLDREQLERRERVELPEGAGALNLASAEDTVLQKLRWYDLGHRVSDRQWRDVLEVLEVQGDRLDRAYLGRGAEILGIAELLERALAETGSGE